MRTKLSVFCDKVLEAGWLLAVILAPLFFNVYSSRVFEPDKLSLVRSIALIMVSAWLIKVIDGGAWGNPSSPRGRSILAEEDAPGPGLWKRLSGVPLVIPTLLLVFSYLLSTILSIAPEISWWGSYMRLQGTYTTYSYIVIFFLMLSSLRQRDQVDRLCVTIILASLPVSLYGILQHYGLDSLPWSGEVTQRVASNMGNSIFVAAYLIMAVPLTLARLVDSFSTLLKEQEGTIGHALVAGCYTFVLSVQLICIFFTQSRGPWLGLLAGLYVFMLVSLISLRRNISDQRPLNGRDVGRALLFALGSIPLGVVPAYVVAVVLRRGWRWLWLAWVIHTLLVASFLVVFNLPNTPLSSLRELPYIGRLGRVFETESGTGKVRVLIWEGALELITADPVRTIVGYGPETMHVAYNPYYPPDLAYYEARNASPARSHNETFDALVIGGAVGFASYMLVFSSILYFGLKWLGLMESKRQRNLFLLLGTLGALVGIFLPRIFEGTYKMSGVGLPAGFIGGVSIYLMIAAAMFYRKEAPSLDQTGLSREEQTAGLAQKGQATRQLLLIGLLSAIVAHFVEIHFGIAIASTRVHFWVYAALFVLLGMNWIRDEEPAAVVQEIGHGVYGERAGGSLDKPSRRARRKAKREAVHLAEAETLRETRPASRSLTTRLIIGSLIVSVILFTMGFEFVANPMGEMDTLRIIQLSLTTLTPKNDPRTSYGTLWMFFLTWLVGAIVVLAEVERGASPVAVSGRGAAQRGAGWWLSSLGIYAAVTLTTFIVGIAVHASRIRPGVDISSTISFFYQSVALFGLLIALALTLDRRLPQRLVRLANSWAYVLILALAVVVVMATNVDIVRADIYYKQGLKLEEDGRYDVAIQLYDRAIQLTPSQDYYYLFLGRALMGRAGTATDNTQRIEWFQKSYEALDKARRLNPLNTDHYANLGRLNRNWADVASTEEERAQKLQLAHDYYVEATTLSPHNVQLFNEWAMVYLARGDNDGALEKINQSLSMDPKYFSTHLLLGNFYASQGNLEEAAVAYRQAIEYNPEDAEAHSTLGYLLFEQGNITDALTYNLKAVELNPGLARAHSTLGLIYYRLGRVEEAVEENLKVLQSYPNDFISHRNLALLYQQLGQLNNALVHAQAALPLASGEDQTALQSFVEQLQAQLAVTVPQQ
jgi:tetratricopeptide (TPR) repeat protein